MTDRIMEVGTYVGNGTSRPVDVGWQPALVVISASAGTVQQSYKTIDMPGDDYMACSTASVFTTTNGITITSTGFSVGSGAGVNGNGNTYYWQAFRVGPHVDTGTYVGDRTAADTTTRLIDLDRQAGIAVILRTVTADSTGWLASFGVNHFFSFISAVTDDLTLPVRTNVDGFTVANSVAASDFNLTGDLYYYFALYAASRSERFLETGNQDCNGTGSLTIVNGWQPRAVWCFTANGPTAAFKTIDMPGDDYGSIVSAYAFDTTGGITINSNGFSVGTDLNTAPPRSLCWVSFV